ncbi:hypothetical protein DL96DRAFT_1629732 [Flagelloscypha sp. PMI_526]|nr:hypothetical protein DL96DRAFT_1629732 [Flagelloscypha sp. PMI_526]
MFTRLRLSAAHARRLLSLRYNSTEAASSLPKYQPVSVAVSNLPSADGATGARVVVDALHAHFSKFGELHSVVRNFSASSTPTEPKYYASALVTYSSSEGADAALNAAAEKPASSEHPSPMKEMVVDGLVDPVLLKKAQHPLLPLNSKYISFKGFHGTTSDLRSLLRGLPPIAISWDSTRSAGVIHGKVPITGTIECVNKSAAAKTLARLERMKGGNPLLGWFMPGIIGSPHKDYANVFKLAMKRRDDGSIYFDSVPAHTQPRTVRGGPGTQTKKEPATTPA